MLGAFKGSPTRALELEAAIPPPEIRFEKLCNMHALRTLRFQPNHPVIQAVQRLTEDELGEHTGHPIAYIPETNSQLLALLKRVRKLVQGNWNIEKPYADWEAPWTTFPATFVVTKQTKEDEANAHNALLNDIQLLQGDAAQIFYTDGSQKKTATAAGVCRMEPEGGFDITKHWSLGEGIEIADAEVFAVSKALALALENIDTQTRLIYIFVDSQAAIARLQSCRGVKTVQDAMSIAQQLKDQGVKVFIQWCPSHMGIAGNELADTLAKQAVESRQPQIQPIVSLGHLKRLAKKEITTTWQHLWQTWEAKEESGKRVGGMGRGYRLISKDSLSFSLRPKPIFLNLPKATISAYIQLKTGKGLLKSFQYAIRRASDDKCFCSAAKRQDTRHLLLECKEFAEERKMLIKRLKGIPLGLIVLFCTTPGHKALIEFLQDTKICTMGWQTTSSDI